ncbi:hypothetical protein [Alicyclobacillus fastidiosus]|uniref:Uncharacterized protein n=1 Tax=Alicyclobacillus fastidiosus TaxID=392011 RepID=A0ABV5A9W4_9BACL|nr:hypothetical protein [Alicyclobacillus fastidiosus]WEH10977.1 hypothetical protein PYS47_07105 [Alicyclobacillus fastidiosus]
MTLVQITTSPEAIAVYSLAVAGLEKKFQFIKPTVKFLKDHSSAFAPVVQEGEKLAGEVLHSPKVEELKLKLSHTENELSNNKLVQLAGQVLYASGKRLNELTPDQKTGIALVVSTEAKKLGLTVRSSAISDALSVADKAVDAISALPLFQSTKEIDSLASADQVQPSASSEGQVSA